MNRKMTMALHPVGKEPLSGLPANLPGKRAMALCGRIDLAK